MRARVSFGRPASTAARKEPNRSRATLSSCARSSGRIGRSGEPASLKGPLVSV